MFDDLNKYKKNDHFFLRPTDALEEVCNGPADKDGVYIVYELKNGRINMVYIGSSGVHVSGPLKDGLRGLKESIINGPSSEKTIHAQSWPIKMLMENIEALDIYWWATYYGNLKDHPATIQIRLLHIYSTIYGELPKWNKRAKSV